jgi:SpoVK/Ycf46/Vps4 family AAA+-type ATPase
MTASANVLQMVRAHFRDDHVAFGSAALALARATKINSIKVSIEMEVRDGMRRNAGSRSHRPTQLTQPGQLLQIKPPACDLLVPIQSVSFADLLLPDYLQADFDEIVTELEYRDELAERKLRASDRILLHGPPGNGKTSGASAIASALSVQAFAVSLPNLIESYLGATGRLFDSLTHDTLCVFDEIDAIGSARGGTEQAAGKENNSIVNTFLTLMDRCDKGIIIATTNRLDILDPALVRRFERVIEVPAPTRQQMVALASKLCEGYGINQIDVGTCSNFDEVTKLVKREAKRLAMTEILAAEAEEEEDNGNQENTGT